MSYLGPNEIIFNNDSEQGINAIGFSVNSIMLKNKISPIRTINTHNLSNADLVSDLFNDLVVPNWAFTHSHNSHNSHNYDDSCEDENNSKYNDCECENNEVIDEQLYDRLFDLIRQDEIQTHLKNKKRRATKKMILKHMNNKKTKRSYQTKSTK